MCFAGKSMTEPFFVFMIPLGCVFTWLYPHSCEWATILILDTDSILISYGVKNCIYHSISIWISSCSSPFSQIFCRMMWSVDKRSNEDLGPLQGPRKHLIWCGLKLKFGFISVSLMSKSIMNFRILAGLSHDTITRQNLFSYLEQ